MRKCFFLARLTEWETNIWWRKGACVVWYLDWCLCLNQTYYLSSLIKCGADPNSGPNPTSSFLPSEPDSLLKLPSLY